MPNYNRSVKISSLELESTLEKVITEMIAKDLGVKPEEVTSEFIHKWREEKLYPVADIDLTTLYGGYNGAGRQVLTGNQIKSNEDVAEEFFSHLPCTKDVIP